MRPASPAGVPSPGRRPLRRPPPHADRPPAAARSHLLQSTAVQGLTLTSRHGGQAGGSGAQGARGSRAGAGQAEQRDSQAVRVCDGQECRWAVFMDGGRSSEGCPLPFPFSSLNAASKQLDTEQAAPAGGTADAARNALLAGCHHGFAQMPTCLPILPVRRVCCEGP